MPRQEPLLTAGEKTTAVIGMYWFGHQWEPWRGNAQRTEQDLERIAALNVNTLLVKHPPSCSLDRNWKWLDRDHELAKAKGLYILPFLEREAGADMAAHAGEVGRRLGLTVPLGLTQTGAPSHALIWKEEAQAALASYAKLYLQRYLDQGAILRVMWHGRPRPVISLSAETGWDGVSFDAETSALFQRWLQDRYGDIGRLNAAWRRQYPSFAAIEPRDSFVFCYDSPDKTHMPAPVRDHALFRAELVSRSLKRVANQLRAQYPDLLFCAEVRYSFASPEPAAQAYRWSAAMLPEIVDYADIVVVRMAGKLWPADWPILRELSQDGKLLILAHRIGRPGGWKQGDGGPMAPKSYADTCIPAEAAAYANGLAWDSWNDMDGPHLVGHRDTPRLVGMVGKVNGAFRRLVGGSQDTIDFTSAWEMDGPTNANIIAFGGTPETKVLPYWVAENRVADMKRGRDETGTYREAQPPKRGDIWAEPLAEIVFDDVLPERDIKIQLRVGSKRDGQVAIRFMDSARSATLWSESAACGRRVGYVEWLLPLSRMNDKRGHLEVAPMSGVVRAYEMRVWMQPAG